MNTIRLSVDLQGKLVMSQAGNATINSLRDRGIEWVKTSSKIAGFKIVSKGGSPPFETSIPDRFQTRVSLNVVFGHPRSDWQYGLIWRDSSGNDTPVDPILAIRPSRSFHFLIGLVLSLFGMSCMILFRNMFKKHSKNNIPKS